MFYNYLDAHRTALTWAPKSQAMSSFEKSTDNNHDMGDCAGRFSINLLNSQLIPINDICVDHSKTGHWTAIGADPQILLECATGTPLPVEGAYLFSLNLQCSSRHYLARLYVDYGQGMTQVHSISLPGKSETSASRVVIFNAPVVALRLDPMEAPGHFCIKDLRIEPLSGTQATALMLDAVTEALANETILPAQPQEGINTELQQSASFMWQLYRQYQQLFTASRQGITYGNWLDEVEALALPSSKAVVAHIKRWKNCPLISVLLPVFNAPIQHLKACIDSVLAQSYPHWQLCIADDKSSNPDVVATLLAYARADQRIMLCFRRSNGHISRGSNSALKLATGDYVALLDHDDQLAPHALLFVAQAIQRHRSAQILYSDEDKIDEQGQRFEPHFKSGWNPDLFFSQNYVSHLGVFRRDLLQRIGGFRAGVEGSQDQDLLLRCLPHVRGQDIVHIPRVLYHWRAVAGSTALASAEKSYTTQAGIKALRDYFAAHGPAGVAVEAGTLPNTYRVRWPLPSPPPLVSLLIPTRDKLDVLKVAVESILRKTTYPYFEVLILDNGSTEKKTLKWLAAIQQQDSRVRVLPWRRPFNFSAINNFGVRHAHGSIVGLINNDVEVINPDWLTEMVSHAVRDDIGCVGAKLYYSNDTLQHGGVVLGIGGVAGHSHKYLHRSEHGYFSRLRLVQNVSAVTAACLLVRKQIYQQVGGLDEKHLRVAFNDVDFCLKVRQGGYRNLWTPHAELYHHESVSRGAEDTPAKQKRFAREVAFMQAKWGKSLQEDPYYSPNLTREREDFSIGSETGQLTPRRGASRP